MRVTAIIFLAAIGLFSCKPYFEDGKHKPFGFGPSVMLLRGLPDGDTSYDQGFRDGCNTAIGITGSGMHRTYGFEYDVNRGIEDKEYYRGFRMGTSACVYYLDVDVL